MCKISKVTAREVLDSHGNPMIEANVMLTSGHIGTACTLASTSASTRETFKLRNNTINGCPRKNVVNSIEIINTKMHPALIGLNATRQQAIDETMIELDDTHNKSNLGANVILAVSLATAKATALYLEQPLYQYMAALYGSLGKLSLPLPMMNIIKGSKYARNSIDIQEFMIQPISAKSCSQGLRMGTEVFHQLKKILAAKGLDTNVDDEGVFAPNLGSNEEALVIIKQAVEQAGYQLGKDFTLALDCAARNFYLNGKYVLAGENKTFDSEGFSNYLAKLTEKYPIISIEDGLDESDWQGWSYLTKRLGNKIQLVGDDLFVTNAKILKQGIQKSIANSILIKCNKIGTLTEIFAAIDMAKASGYSVIISQSSAEAEDTIIADLAVATCAGQIKTGSISHSNRVAKYNRLLHIEEQLSNQHIYNGLAEVYGQKGYQS